MRLPRAAPAAALALLMLSGLLAAPAAAQASPTVEVTADSSQGTVSVERETTFRFTVKNTSPGTGTPLDQQNKARIDIATPPPAEGWTANAEPHVLQLAPDESGTVTVRVQVAPGAARQAALVVQATITAISDPIVGQIPGAPPQTTTGEATMELSVQESFTRNVMETLGPWIYVMLLLLVAAIVVAIGIAVASRRTLIRLTADVRELAVPPGGKVAFAFQVESLAKDTDTALLQVSAVPEGWAAFLPVPELVLEPGQPQEVSLVVIAPRSATQGTRQAILVTATSAKAPRGAANLEVVAIVEGIEELPTAPRRAK